jgi:hypothetical protein
MSLIQHKIHPLDLGVIALLVLQVNGAQAQMLVGQDSLYGNEWIDYSLEYYRIPVAEDGIYKLSYEVLVTAGIPVDQIQGGQWRMFNFGQEVALEVTNTGSWGPGDYLTFYAEKNRSTLDRHFYPGGLDDMLNPEYSVITDTAVYYLTWTTDGSSSKRFILVGNDQSNPPTSEQWFEYKQIQSFSNRHYMYAVDGVAESVFTRGEGFAGNQVANQTLTIDLVGLALVPSNVQIEVRMVSNTTDHDLRITWNGDEVHQENYYGYELRQLSFYKVAADVPQMQSINIAGQASGSDRFAVSILSATYPRHFAIGNIPSFSLRLPPAPGDRQLVFTGVTPGDYRIYTLNSNNYLIATSTGDTVRFSVPETLAQEQLQFIRVDQGFKSIISISPASIKPLVADQIDYLIISHPTLFDDGNGQNQVQAYADFRASADGGTYSISVVSITDLYDQFSYGVQRHPLAIRNFVHALEKTGNNPDFLFLIGKGRQYNLTRTKSSLAQADNQSYFIPTYGAPGADNLLVTHPFTNNPTTAVGRLAAETGDEVRMYLTKVIQHENGLRSPDYEERLWRKEVVHLGGGASAGEQQSIHAALDQMEQFLREGLIGANVTSFYKTSSDPVQYSVSQELTRRINEGTGLVTFFGHSGAGGFDFSIDDPRNFTNKGRYPVMLSLGCYSGQIHEGFKSVGENFVFQEEKAALAFFATTGLGYVSALRTLALEYMALSSSDAYGKSIGEILQESLLHFNDNQGFGMRVLLQQFTLMGDPAVRVFMADGPDYWVAPQSVNVGPVGLSENDDSLMVQIPIINTGKNTGDTLTVRLEHFLPDGSLGSVSDHSIIINRYSQNLTVLLPVGGEKSGGENRIFITLDPEHVLAETPSPEARENNVYIFADGKPGHPFTVLSNTAYPAYPLDFGIVGETPIQLRAFTANVFAAELDYIMQIDTSPQFDSPLFREQLIRQSGGVIHWTPDIQWIDSTVYFWRISPSGNALYWRSHSFVYIPGSSPGWHQSHPAQLKQNSFDNLVIDDNTGKLRYAYDVRTVKIKNAVHPKFPIGVDFDNDPHYFIIWDGPVNRGIYVFAVDPVTAKPWINLYPGFYGSHQPTPWAVLHGHFPYWTNTPEWREKAINFIRDTIPSGYYVLIYTIQYENTSYMPETWAADSITLGTNLFQVLENQGAQLLRSTAVDGPKPYILMYKKDDPTWPVLERLGELDAPLEETVLLNGLWDQGTMVSQTIGPAKKWTNLSFDLSEITPEDEWQIALWGRRQDGSRALLLPEITTNEIDLSFIDANEFPYLDLDYFSADSVLRSAVQLDYWQIKFDGLPDLALNPSNQLQWSGDTIHQGQTISIDLSIENLQAAPADSVHMRFILSGEGSPNQIVDQVYPPLAGSDSLRINWSWTDTQRAGPQALQLLCNPGPVQSETEYRNNAGSLSFYIIPDEQIPVLTVTFDGVQIKQNDLVSGHPSIAMTLVDGQSPLRLQDTSMITFWLQGPDGGPINPVYYLNSDVTFFPALSTGPNRAETLYQPTLVSGEYVLFVKGRDAAGNSNVLDYEVRFYVNIASSLTHFWVTPNPAGSSTRFQYRLTGDQNINNYTVNLYDIKGRLARVLTASDLGPLQVGEHQTNSWNPTTLPSGTYFYDLLIPDHTDWSKPVFDHPQGNADSRPILIIH